MPLPAPRQTTPSQSSSCLVPPGPRHACKRARLEFQFAGPNVAVRCLTEADNSESRHAQLVTKAALSITLRWGRLECEGPGWHPGAVRRTSHSALAMDTALFSTLVLALAAGSTWRLGVRPSRAARRDQAEAAARRQSAISAHQALLRAKQHDDWPRFQHDLLVTREELQAARTSSMAAREENAQLRTEVPAPPAHDSGEGCAEIEKAERSPILVRCARGRGAQSEHRGVPQARRWEARERAKGRRARARQAAAGVRRFDHTDSRRADQGRPEDRRERKKPDPHERHHRHSAHRHPSAARANAKRKPKVSSTS